MAEQLKIVIDADVQKAITGIQKFEKSIEHMATGSIAQLRKAALQLRTQLENLTPAQLSSDFGRQLTGALKTVNTEIKSLEKNSIAAGNATGGAFNKAFSGAKQLANIVPGLGLSTLFGVAIGAVTALGEALITTSNKAATLRGAIGEAIGSSAGEVFKINAAVATIKDLNSSIDAQTNARAFLNKATGISVDLLSREKIGSDEVAAAITRATTALYNKALAEAFAAKSAQKQVELFEKQQKLNAALASAPTTLLKTILNPTGLANAATAAGILSKQIGTIKQEILEIEKFGQDAFKKAFDVPPEVPKPVKIKVKAEIKDFVLPEGLRPIKVPAELDFTNFFSTQIPNDLFKDIFPTGGKQSKLINGLVPGVSEDVAKKNKEFFDAFQQQVMATADLVTGVLAPAFTNMFDAITQNKDPLKAFFDGLKDAVNQLIKKLIQAAIQAAVLSALGFAASGGATGFSAIFSSLLGFTKGGQANFGLGGAVGSRAFNNVIQVNVVGQISGQQINLVSQRAANSNLRGG